jgi:hypothetical protein
MAFSIPSFLRLTGVSSFYQLLHLVSRFRKNLYLVLVPFTPVDHPLSNMYNTLAAFMGLVTRQN